MNPLMRFGAWLLLKRPTRSRTLASLADSCERHGQQLATQLADLADNDANRQQLSHIMGIERWGQSRLKVALGEPLKQDEYDGYRPDPATSWADLVASFSDVRAETVDLARRIEAAGAGDTPIRHNQFGDLDPRAWLYYLTFHADQEAKRLK